MERRPFNTPESDNLNRWRQIRQAGLWLASAFRRKRQSSAETEPRTTPEEVRAEEASWWSAWPEDRWRGLADAQYPIRDPDHYSNYARYEPDDELHAVRSNADLAAWFVRQKATTPPKTRYERLAEIAASEPYSDHDFFRDPETGEVAIWENTPDGLAPCVPEGPSISPRPRRPRDPSEPDFFFDVNDGGIKERLPDGSVRFISQSAAQEWN